MRELNDRMYAYACSAAFVMSCLASPVSASPFDGSWNMLVTTTSGHCGKIKVGLAVNRGRRFRAQARAHHERNDQPREVTTDDKHGPNAKRQRKVSGSRGILLIAAASISHARKLPRGYEWRL